MSTPLTPGVLAKLREYARLFDPEGDNGGFVDSDIMCICSSLPALLDAAEELERVKKWAGCRQCQNDHTAECDDCVVNWKVTKFKPLWNKEATR